MSTSWKTPYSKPVIYGFWSTVGGIGIALVMTIISGVQEARSRAAIITTPVALPAESGIEPAPVAPNGIAVPATPSGH